MTAPSSKVNKKEEKYTQANLFERLHYESFSVAQVQPKYRRKLRPEEMPKVTSDEDVHALLMEIWDKDKLDYCEQMYALFLNRANKVHAWALVGEGGIGSCQVYPQKIFTLALITNSAALILAHNHPSSDLTVSNADWRITTQMLEASKVIGVSLVDHLVVNSLGEYVSLRAERSQLFS